jgi:EAL domain-containing protein (putative c-di-GMP-specific phosphodiesterase class I)
MADHQLNRKAGCSDCRELERLGFDISMAFQPIVDLDRGAVFAHEALVRGPNGEPAASIFAKVDESNLYRFDQACRVKAIEMAARLGLDVFLSINFMPNAVYRAETCIQTTLQAAAEHGFPVDRIIFEITEADRVADKAHLRNIVEYYKKRGFQTAIDDFGAGYAGLNLLAEFVPDLVKLDMELVRAIDADRTRQAIVRHMIGLCSDLGVRVVAEGIETREELQVLRDLGVSLFQGYLLARPGFQALPQPAFDSLS